MLLKLPLDYVQQNPWLTIANKQLELMHKYLSEFGLSPVSRSRVSIAGVKPLSKFAGLLGLRDHGCRPMNSYLSGSESVEPPQLGPAPSEAGHLGTRVSWTKTNVKRTSQDLIGRSTKPALL